MKIIDGISFRYLTEDEVHARAQIRLWLSDTYVWGYGESRKYTCPFKMNISPEIWGGEDGKLWTEHKHHASVYCKKVFPEIEEPSCVTKHKMIAEFCPCWQLGLEFVMIRAQQYLDGELGGENE